MNKLQLVKSVLARNPSIAEWYRITYGIDAATLTHEDVRTYGYPGKGDVCDAILAEPEAAEILAAEVAS